MDDTEVVYSELVEYPLPEYIVTYRTKTWTTICKNQFS